MPVDAAPRPYALGPSERDTFRHLTLDELSAFYERDRCPFCGESALNFIHGPRGGMSLNVECPRCECRLNIIAPIPSGALYSVFGQLIRAPRPERLT